MPKINTPAALVHTLVHFDKNVTVLNEGNFGSFKHLLRKCSVVWVSISMLKPKITGVIGIASCREIR